MNKIKGISILVIVFILGFILVGCGGGVDLGENDVKVKESASSLVGTHYQNVVEQLEVWGFSNIETLPVYDIIWGITKEGTTKSVKIGGSESFSSGDIYDKDISILVTYSMKVSNDHTKQKYTITWQYEDGTVIKTDEVLWGEIPRYTHETPVKASTNNSQYTFSGWTPKIDAVTGEKSYIAVFSESQIGLSKVEVRNSESYFIGKNYEEVVETLQEWGFTNIEILPVYDIIWGITKEGTTKSVKIGGSESFSSGAIYDKDISILVTFSMKTSNEPSKQTFDITWENDDGTTLKTNKVIIGTTPDYSGNEPTKAAVEEKKYVFNGWTPELKPVTENKTYTATFIEVENIFTVTYNLDGGQWELENSQNILYNGLITSTIPSKDGYDFAGWDIGIPTIMNDENITITAQWSVNSYTLQYVDEDNELLQSTDYEYAADLANKEVPLVSKEGHTFTGWDQILPVNMPSNNLTLRAQYSVNEYTITFDTKGGELEKTEIVLEYGTTFYSLTEPRKLGFVFLDWSVENEDMAFPYTMIKNIQISANYREMLPHELIWDYYTNISLSDKIIVNHLDGYVELLSDDPSGHAIYNKEGTFGFYFDLNNYEFVIIMDLVNSKFYYFDENDYNYERDFLYKSNSGNVSKEDYLFIEEMFVGILKEFENGILKTLSETYGNVIKVNDFNEGWDELVLLSVNYYMTYDMQVMEHIIVSPFIGYTPSGKFAEWDYQVINYSDETIYYLKIQFGFYIETSDGYVAIHKETITYYTYLVPSDFDDKTMYILLSKLQDENGNSKFDFLLITVLDVSF